MKHLSESIEEYLETIYRLIESGRTASTTEISRTMNIAPASVTQMLKKLDSEGYVKYSPYRGAVLTERGYRVARRMTRKHRILERFLHDILRIKREKIYRQACEMEHSLSDDAERALCHLLNVPGECPDKNPIPACDFKFSTCEECLEMKDADIEEIGCRDEKLRSLREMDEEETGRVSFIRGDYRVVRRLMDMGITIGVPLKVIKKAPLNGPVEVEVRSSRVALGRDIADNVFIDTEEE
ncbi:DtxR family transcriptional regulator [Methanothermobacter sp. DSM 3267]|uniref:metal-dependent transcriptional regulator n=1 Tax=Methanothermobacter sp. DSM 3267 TaxID=3381696 RepID=UPI003EB7632D